MDENLDKCFGDFEKGLSTASSDGYREREARLLVNAYGPNTVRTMIGMLGKRMNDAVSHTLIPFLETALAKLPTNAADLPVAGSLEDLVPKTDITTPESPAVPPELQDPGLADLLKTMT